MLSDEQKREIYDKLGKDGLEDSGVEISLKDLLTLLFGGGKFVDHFGELPLLKRLDEKFISLSDEEKENAMREFMVILLFYS